MTITIKLSTSNAAFQDGNCTDEVCRILDGMIERLKIYGTDNDSWRVHDSNGNAVGTVKVTSGKRSSR